MIIKYKLQLFIHALEDDWKEQRIKIKIDPQLINKCTTHENQLQVNELSWQSWRMENDIGINRAPSPALHSRRGKKTHCPISKEYTQPLK